jgi:hypothetical protein
VKVGEWECLCGISGSGVRDLHRHQQEHLDIAVLCRNEAHDIYYRRLSGMSLNFGVRLVKNDLTTA